jgi:4-hydroxybenzoate polyprenyltransferase
MKKITDYVHLARVHHYVKNGIIWIPIFFGHKLHDVQLVAKTFIVFAAFCLAASSVYVLNDLLDAEDDRKHPLKKNRPIARGLIPARDAILFSLILAGAAIATSVALLPSSVVMIIIAYLALNLGYSVSFKKYAVVDIVCIAVGFVLRIFAGGLAIDVPISHWLILMIFLLAVFLALTKRRDDLMLTASGHNTRRSLDGYNLEFINFAMVAMTSVVIVCYILYTVSPEVIDKHGTDKLYLTTLWVIVGLLRYMQIAFVEQKSGSPTRIILKDYFLQAVIVLWIIHIYFILYVNR